MANENLPKKRFGKSTSDEHLKLHLDYVRKHIPKPTRIPVKYYEELKPGVPVLIAIGSRDILGIGETPIVNEGGRAFFVHTWE